MKKEECIFEYEQVLLGIQNDFGACYFGKSKSERTENFATIWQYAIGELLHWTPQMASLYLNSNLIKMLKLDKTTKFLDIKIREWNSIKDYDYILRYVYPKEIKYGDDDWVIDEYEHVAKIGAWKHNRDKYAYADKFFSGGEGMERACLLLRHAIGTFLGDLSTEELYEFFGKSSSARNWLSRHALSVPTKKIYESPLDYLHDALISREGEADDFFYYANMIENVWRNDPRNPEYKEMRTKGRKRNQL